MSEKKIKLPPSEKLCIAGAVCFTALCLIFPVPWQISTWHFVFIALLAGLMGCGLVKAWDWRALFNASVIGGALLLSFGTLALFAPAPLKENMVEGTIKCVVTFPFFWAVLAVFRLVLQGIQPLKKPCRKPMHSALAVSGYSAVALLLFWARYFYPSGTSPDTVQQWGQIHGTLRYNDIHALGHTIFLKGLLTIWDSYAIVILVNILMVSLLYGAFAHYLAGKGVSLGTLVLAVSLFTGCGPSAYVYMYPWKDTPYTIALGVLSLLMIYIVDGDVPFTVPKAILFGVALAYSTLFRLNGIVVLLFASVWIVIWCIKNKAFQQLAAVALAAGVCFAGVNWYGYGVLKAESPKNGYASQVFASGLAAMVTQCGDDLSPEDRAEIGQYLSLDWMESQYAPWQNYKLIWTEDDRQPGGVFDDPNMDIFSNQFVLDVGEHRDEVIGLYFRLMPKHFMVCLQDVLYNTYLIWGLSGLPNFLASNIFLLVLLMVGVGAVWKKASIARRLVVFAPMLCNVVSIAISTITNETRYLLPTFTLFPMLLLYLVSTSDRFAEPGQPGSQWLSGWLARRKSPRETNG